MRYKYCHKCRKIKPPRAHHCSVCDACVMRMDHHCPWVGNCVGIHNHKFFWNFLLYAFFGTLEAALCLLIGGKGFTEIQQDIAYMVAGIMSCAFSLSIGSLLIFHSYLLMFNLSTIEAALLHKHNPFGKPTVRANLMTIFGTDKRTWLLPIKPKEGTCDGINYNVKAAFN